MKKIVLILDFESIRYNFPYWKFEECILISPRDKVRLLEKYYIMN
jgi:hypothetical protein